MSTLWPTGSTSTAASHNITSIYSNTLNYDNPTFVRPGGNPGYAYYYQAVQVTTYTRGAYSFRSSSSMDTYGCLYRGSFNPTDQNHNLITCDDDSGGDRQFQINSPLERGAVYILVVTTSSSTVFGIYSVMAVGPGTVSMTSVPTLSTTTSWSTTSTSSSTTSSYAGALKTSSRTFLRPDASAGNYYYQAIQVITYTPASYTFRSNSSIDTYGCLYNGAFNPLNPTRNLIMCDADSGGAYQFQIIRDLVSGAAYVLVVTTFSPGITGYYSAMAVGPGTVSMTSYSPLPTTTSSSPTSTFSPTTSSYAGALYYSGPTFLRPDASAGNYYYQAIQVITYTPASYTFRSNSSIDTYGCLYIGYFYPSYPNRNWITCDDDSGGAYQFQITRALDFGAAYVLVVTTFSHDITGSYSAIAVGPGTVSMTPLSPLPTTTSSSPTSTSYPATSSYAGALYYSSPTFLRPNSSRNSSYYYQAIQVTTYTSGLYSFKSSSSMDTYGCLYRGYFYPSRSKEYLIACDDDSGGAYQFRINLTLIYSANYVLVVTTFSPSITGSYSVIAVGPGAVYMSPIAPPTTAAASTTTVPSSVTTNYVNSLEDDSPTFTRPSGYEDNAYHYQAIQVTSSVADFYTLSSISQMNTYGCLYDGDFDHSDPSSNLIRCNDYSDSGIQFLINYYLDTSRSYTLVVTTSAPSMTGSYTVQVTGPARVGMTSISPFPSSIWTTLAILIVSLTCAVVLLTIVAICIYRRKQRNPERHRLCSGNHSPTRSAKDVFDASAQGNRPLYAVPRAGAPSPVVAEAPPSYEAFMAFSPPPPPQQSDP